MRIERVAPQHVALVWPLIGEFVCAALARQRRQLFGEWDIERSLLTGHPWALWVVREEEKFTAAIVTRIDDYPLMRGCVIVTCGGLRMGEWFETARMAIEAYAKQLGCRFLEARGRRGWLRYAGARCDDLVMRKDL